MSLYWFWGFDVTDMPCPYQRFFPSEFGNDVDRAQSVEPAKSAYATKAMFRRRIEEEGIPYTIVSCNFFAGYFLPTLAQPGATSPPRDKVIIMGDGTPKGKVRETPTLFSSKIIKELATSDDYL